MDPATRHEFAPVFDFWPGDGRKGLFPRPAQKRLARFFHARMGMPQAGGQRYRGR